MSKISVVPKELFEDDVINQDEEVVDPSEAVTVIRRLSRAEIKEMMEVCDAFEDELS